MAWQLDDYRHGGHHQSPKDRAGGPGDNVLYQRPSAEPEDAGWFRYYFDDDRWEWSPEVQRMHGYEPGSVTPTTSLVLAHKYPEDYRHVAQTLKEIRRSHQPFTSRHRICDTQGNVHHVIVVADHLRDDDGTVIGTHGYYIDVTPTLETRRQQMSAAVAEFAERRAPIEQAKGMLMTVYNIDDDEAFNLLSWLSQRNNVKLRILAAQVVADFSGARHDGHLLPRSSYDNLLMTAHRRIDTASHHDGDGTAQVAESD